MKLVVKQRSLKVLAVMLIYKILLDYAYLGIIAKKYDYLGMTQDIDVLKIAVSYVCIFGLWMLTPTGNYKVLDIFLNIQLLVMLIPMLTMYGANNENTQYLFMVLVCYAVQCLFCMIYKEHAFVRVNAAKIDVNHFLLAVSLIIACICVLKFGIPSLTALNILRVYEIRAEHVLSFPLSYLVPWSAKVIIPFGLILSLEEKKYGKAALYLFSQGIVYLLFAHKMYLFIIIMAGAVWFVCRKGWLYQALYAVFPIGIAGSIFLYKVFGEVLAVSFLVRRGLMVPASLKFVYYEYYSSHPKAFFYDSIIGKVFGTESVYNKSMAAQIGEYLGRPQTMMNTGYLGESYGQGGYFVLIIMSLLILAVCKMCTVKKGVNMNIFLPMFVLWFYTLNDGAFQTSLITGGGLILLLIFAVWPERRNINSTEKISASKLMGIPHIRKTWCIKGRI